MARGVDDLVTAVTSRPHRPALGEHVPVRDVLALVSASLPANAEAIGGNPGRICEQADGDLRVLLGEPRHDQKPASRVDVLGGVWGGARPPPYSVPMTTSPVADIGWPSPAFTRTGPCGLARDATTAALLCTMLADFLTENG
jgi:hypothetical protein